MDMSSELKSSTRSLSAPDWPLRQRNSTTAFSRPGGTGMKTSLSHDLHRLVTEQILGYLVSNLPWVGLYVVFESNDMGGGGVFQAGRVGQRDVRG